MSKSYDNTIPLFSTREQLKKLIGGIVTDSRAPGEPKDTEGSALFQLYQAFSSIEETEAMRQAFANGIGWGDAKHMLFERIDAELAPKRARYEDLMAHPEKVEAALQLGAERARALTRPFITSLRAAVGLRSLANQDSGAKKSKSAKVALPSFKQYREADGKFYFKFMAADGRLLLQSTAFDQPKLAGQSIAQLQQQGADALTALAAVVQPADGVTQEDIEQALHVLQEAAKA